MFFYIRANASRNTGRNSNQLRRHCPDSREKPAINCLSLRGITRKRNLHSPTREKSATEVEICDEFWPYTKEGSSVPQSDFAQYCTGIKFLLSKRSCIQCEFTGADENFAAELFGRKIALSQVERAIALACCRKYAGFLNGTDGEMIHRFSYFRDSIEEILDPEAHPIQAQLLDQRILTAEYLEAKWLAKQERGADAEVSQAAQSNSKRRDDAYDSRKLDGVAERMALECNS